MGPGDLHRLARCALVCPMRRSGSRCSIRRHRGRSRRFRHQGDDGSRLPGKLLTVQVMPDDCTGCGVCVDVCPAISKEEVRHKAINMLPKAPHLARERANRPSSPRSPSRAAGRSSWTR